MSELRRTLAEKAGKWTVINTKSGSFYGKIESVNRKGVTVLLPDHYTVNDPSVKLLEENVNVKEEDVQASQRFFRRRRRRRFFFRRFFFPFFFFI
ncbi:MULTISPECIES: hypothetical protein [Aneurinibacillus]|jgi:hypothetical protein|uniref:Uncharacterized protein n=1 Tax=Aneurinibacillus danicus TaxID=267746 RepID=A0A511VA38_9BACL|nr:MULTISPECIES: hypothetical protein [Aneurinibacillus]GEN35787.1 hypothetical protein ADA01nite_32470 [Aneurinibacillus danicus]